MTEKKTIHTLCYNEKKEVPTHPKNISEVKYNALQATKYIYMSILSTHNIHSTSTCGGIRLS